MSPSLESWPELEPAIYYMHLTPIMQRPGSEALLRILMAFGI
jgi:hypothetical protein